MARDGEQATEVQDDAEPEAAETGTAPAETSTATATEDEASAATEAEPDADAEAQEAAPADPWESFAPAVPHRPSRLARITAGLGRGLRHEWTLAALGSVALAAVLTWPTLRHPTTTIPQDLGDPTMQAWQLAWTGHALISDPANVWNANVQYPEPNTLAFSDSLLGYAPFGILGSGPAAALLRYNILYVLAFALAFFGAYALVRQLGANKYGAAVAGAAFAYAPWRFAHAGHLNILSTGGIALALAMLARGHGWSLRDGFARDRVRPGWALAGWLVAAWQVSLGFGLGIAFGYILIMVILVGAVGWLIRRRRMPIWLIAADLGGGLFFGAMVLVLSLPYLRVVEQHPDARRTVEWLDAFSPPLRGLLTATQESRLWGEAHAASRASLSWPPEMTLLPGFFLAGLAIAGLFVSIWTVRQRLFLGLGVLVTAWLAMGTTTPGKGEYGYLLLYRLLPGFDAIRTPGRLVLWTTLLLGVLAAGAVAAFAGRGDALVAERPKDRPNGWIQALAAVPLVLVLIEGLHSTPNPVVPAAPAVLATAADPIAVLPTDEIGDMHVMLWSTAGFPRVVNGSSGYSPPRRAQIRETLRQFPDQTSLALLRELGVRTVIVLRDRAAGTPYAQALVAPVDGLDVTREDQGYAVVFTLP